MAVLTDSIRVIDSDTHVIEPPDLWTSRLAEKWGDDRPQVLFHEGWGVDRWRVGDRWLSAVGQYNSSRWAEHPPSYPATLEESDPAGYDASARLQRMDEFGLYAQVLYPNIIGFDTDAFTSLKDPKLAIECVRAYNDFLADFASADPNRLLPISMLPFWDVEETVKEMTRCREMGHRGILWAAKLHRLGYPRINKAYWDPVYAAAQDLEMSVNLHIGVGTSNVEDVDFRSAWDGNFHVGAYVAESAVTFTSNMETIATLLVADTFERFPKLQVVSVESGFGYLPYLIESLDWQWKNSIGPQKYPDRRLPSEKFFTNMYGTFWFERQTLPYLTLYPEYADRLMFETDFPHPTSLTPGPASAAENPKVMIQNQLGDLPEEIARKVLHENAAKLYHVK